MQHIMFSKPPTLATTTISFNEPDFDGLFYLFSVASLCRSVWVFLLHTPLPFMCSCFVVFCARRKLFWVHSHIISRVGCTKRRNILFWIHSQARQRAREQPSVRVFFHPRSDWLVRSKKNKTTLLFCMPKRQHAISCLSVKIVLTEKNINCLKIKSWKWRKFRKKKH